MAYGLINDNVIGSIPSIELTENDGVTYIVPSTPPAGQLQLYAKSDHYLYYKDSTGTEHNITTGPNVTPLTTKGDLYTFTTVDARLGVGSNGTFLTADSAQATGLAWSNTISNTGTQLTLTYTGGGNTTLATSNGGDLTITPSGGDVTIVGSLAVVNGTYSGYVEIAEQAIPSAPTNALRLYADTSNRLSWKGENGYVRTFDGTANTADRVYTLPDQAGTILLTTYTGGVAFTAATASSKVLTIKTSDDDTTNNMFEAQQSDGTAFLSIKRPTAANSRAMVINATVADVSTSLGTLTVNPTFTYTGTNSLSPIAAFISPVFNTSGFALTGSLTGYSVSTTVSGGAAATGVIAASVGMTSTGASTVITSGYGFRATSAVTAASGAITSFAAFTSNAQTAATNNTYVLLGTGTIPSGNWTIHATSTNDSAFAGNVRIGSTTAPTVALDVTGSITSSATVTGQAMIATRTVATTSTNGLSLVEDTAASAGTTVRYSPRLRWSGRAWDTAASQTVEFWQEVQPVSAATPTGSVVWSYSLNGAAASTVMQLDNLGHVAFGGAATTTAQVIRAVKTFTDSSTTVVGVNGNMTLSFTADSSTTGYGAQGAVTVTVASTKTYTGNAYGFNALATLTGAGNMSTGTLAGITAQILSTSSGTVTSPGVGVQIAAPSVSGTMFSTVYGLYIGNQTAGTHGTSSYAIFTNAGNVSLLGSNTIASAAGATWKGIEFRAATATITGSTNITTAAGFNYIEIAAPTLSAASALTVSLSATLKIAGPPTGGGAGPATITTPYALWIGSGNSRFEGAVLGLRNAIATTSTDAFWAINTTAATVGTQVQISPRVHWQGQAWETTGGTSKTVQSKTELIPVAGATQDAYLLTSIDSGSGSFTDVLKIYATKVELTDAINLVVGTGTGTKIGTATSQKLSLWNATPIVQPTTGVAAATFVANTSGTLDDSATWDGYTIGQVVKALRNIGALA